MTVEALLQQILEELRLQRKERQSPSGYEWNTVLSLPDHLRKTALVLAQQGRATATDIANITHKARAVESAYLNQLAVQGLAKKERNGREVYFQPEVK
jgi:hypothetical protein